MLAKSLEVHKSFLEDFRSDTLLRKLRYVSSLVDSRHKLILDAGCGNGLAQKFLSESAMYLGIDFNEIYLKSLWRGKKSVPRIEGTVTQLPVRDNFFDVVLNLNVIEHLLEESQKDMLAELFRTLKRGGRLIIITDNPETLFHAESFMSPHNPKHQHCLKYRELKELLFGCGFQHITKKNFDIVLDYPNRFVKILPFILRNRLAGLFSKLDKFLVVEAVKT